MRTKLFFAILLTFSSLYANASFNPESKTVLCLACELPNGLAVSDLTGASATLSWNAVSGATLYTIEIQDEQNNPSTFHIESNVNGTSYSVTGLTAGVLYKFKVRTRCGGDKSDWSDWLFFTASSGGGGGSNTCDIPTLLSSTVNGSSATISWNKVAGAVNYYIEVEDEQNVSSTFHIEVSVQDTFYALTGLQTNVLYKFKVRTHCAGGQSDWSGWSFFNGNFGGGIGGGIGICSKPTNLQSTNLTANTALLTWTAVPGVASYFLEIEREQGGTAPWQITQTVTSNSFLLTGLSADTRYKFKVRSNCTGGGHSKWSQWLKFKTAPSLTGPSVGSMLSSTASNQEDGQLGAAALQVQVWPNPVRSNSTIQIQNLFAGSATLRLFDLAGRLVQSQHIQSESSTWEAELNLSNLPNGLYLLQTQSGASTQTIKLVLSH